MLDLPSPSSDPSTAQHREIINPFPALFTRHFSLYKYHIRLCKVGELEFTINGGYAASPELQLGPVFKFSPHSPVLASLSVSRQPLFAWDPTELRLSRDVSANSAAIKEDQPVLDDVDDQVVVDSHPKVPERDFTATRYVPVYVMLPLGLINMDCELVDPDVLISKLKILKSIKVYGVMVDCWWGIVEANAPQQYNWSGYKQFFR